MESLLRLSGLLTEDDGGKMDLATLEKRLADRYLANGGSNGGGHNNHNMSRVVPRFPGGGEGDEKQRAPAVDASSTSQSADTSPEPPQKHPGGGADVESLSEMMCSLVTNNSGETRFLGMSHRSWMG